MDAKKLKLLYARCLEDPKNEEASKELRHYLWQHCGAIVQGLEERDSCDSALGAIGASLARHGLDVHEDLTITNSLLAFEALQKHQHLVEALQWLPVGTVVDFCDLDDFLHELREQGWRPRAECSHKWLGSELCARCHATKEQAAELDAKKAQRA